MVLVSQAALAMFKKASTVAFKGETRRLDMQRDDMSERIRGKEAKRLQDAWSFTSFLSCQTRHLGSSSRQ